MPARRGHHAASSYASFADVGMETRRSADVGRGPHRKNGFRAMETRTMQHLDPHSQALFETRLMATFENSRDEQREKNTRHLHHGSDNGSRNVHGGGSHMTTATPFDLRQRRMFNPACTCTTQVSTYTLDQQEEMATVLAVLRWRQSARNTNACSPRHTLLSASTRSWLSVSAHQNHDTPPRHGVLSDKNWRNVSQTWRFRAGRHG